MRLINSLIDIGLHCFSMLLLTVATPIVVLGLAIVWVAYITDTCTNRYEH